MTVGTIPWLGAHTHYGWVQYMVGCLNKALSQHKAVHICLQSHDFKIGHVWTCLGKYDESSIACMEYQSTHKLNTISVCLGLGLGDRSRGRVRGRVRVRVGARARVRPRVRARAGVGLGLKLGCCCRSPSPPLPSPFPPSLGLGMSKNSTN